jgi:TPR repeat protein
MMLFRIATGQRLFEKMTPFKLQTEILNGKRPPIPDSVCPLLADMIRECWNDGPDIRPSFFEIVKALHNYDEPLFPGVDMNVYRAYREFIWNEVYIPNEFKPIFSNDIIRADDVPVFRAALTAADKGDLEAQVRVARMYQEGRGTPVNLERSLHYYLEAANRNHRIAQYSLSWAYYNGRGTTPDRQEAARWMERAAADPNFLSAQISVAGFFNNGLTETLTREQLISILERSGDPPHNNARAQYALGKLHLKSNPVKARQYLEAANRAGLANATNELATLNLRGIGGPASFDEAIRLYEQAADRSSAAALHNLATLYSGQKIDGVASPQAFVNMAKAKELFYRAAKLGYKASMLKIGRIIFQEAGEDPPDPHRNKQYIEARKWFKKAADLGDVTGLHNYGKMNALGQGGPVDMGVAMEYLMMAAEKGMTAAYKTIAEFVEQGKNGLIENPDLAERLRERAGQLERIRTGK